MNDSISRLIKEKDLYPVITKIQSLRQRFDPKIELLCFTHVEKQGVEHKIYTDWFDLNFTDSYIWFVYRTDKCYLAETDLMSYRYKNIKIENIKNIKLFKRKELIRKGESINEVLEI